MTYKYSETTPKRRRAADFGRSLKFKDFLYKWVICDKMVNRYRSVKSMVVIMHL